MVESAKSSSAETQTLTLGPISPLVFISHDARDADLAEALSKLLKSVSAGMIKTFRSSDKKGGDGIDFGDEWYKRLMNKLQSTSDVVCLFTERSLDRPWILFEAGVAKGKLDTPVIGIALGIPLSRITTGPFYQFQNMDDSEADLAKLVSQLARRIPNLELDSDVVRDQVSAFKSAETVILKQLSAGSGVTEAKEEPGENSVAKLVEEMKGLPSRVAERLSELGGPIRQREIRKRIPNIGDIFQLLDGESNPLSLLIAAATVRDEAPWLYEIAREIYESVKSGSVKTIRDELVWLDHFERSLVSNNWTEDLSKETRFMCMEFPRFANYILVNILQEKKRNARRRSRDNKEPSDEQ